MNEPVVSELLVLLAGPLSFLLRGDRFRLAGSKADESHGFAAVIVESDDLRLTLIRERSELSMDLTPIGESGEFGPTWIGIYRRLLDGDKGCGDELDAGAIDFLRRRLSEIEERLGREGRLEFVRALEREAHDRAAEMFGPLPEGSD